MPSRQGGPQSQIPNRNNPKSRTSVICHLSSDLCFLSSVFCPLSSVICLLSSVLCHLSSDLCSLSSVICPLSSVLCSLSSVICLLPSVICHLSSVLCHQTAGSRPPWPWLPCYPLPARLFPSQAVVHRATAQFAPPGGGWVENKLNTSLSEYQ